MAKLSKILIILLNMLTVPMIVFADKSAELDESYDTLSKILNAILDAFSWFGYAIAVGILMWLGIQYIMSGANERANLKGKATLYIIGVALITLCSMIAGGVAEIAGKSGDNTAGGIVDVGIELGGLVVGDREKEPINNYDEPEVERVEVNNKYGNKTVQTIVDGVVTKEEVLDENGNVVAEYICGIDDMNREYKYLNNQFKYRNDGSDSTRSTQYIYESLESFEVIDRELLSEKGYTVGELEYRTSEKGDKEEIYKYTVPIFNKKGELEGSYEVTITGWENGFVHTNVEMWDNGKKAGSVEYKILGNDVTSSDDVLKTEYVVKDGKGNQIGDTYINTSYKIGESKETTDKRNQTIEDIKKAMKKINKGGIGIFNDR